ncbi:uncharacterized protein ACIBXB_006045 [Morphnus guianensis]
MSTGREVDSQEKRSQHRKWMVCCPLLGMLTTEIRELSNTGGGRAAGCCTAQLNAALARWAHEKAGHGGRDATIAWAKARGVQLSVKDVQTCIAQCKTCQLLKRHPYLDQPVGRIQRGTTGGEVWQIDYIGPLREHRRQRYICVAVDTYSGVVAAVPSCYSNAHTTIKCLKMIELYYGTPVEIQSDNGTHFKNTRVAQWASDRGVMWTWHLPYHPQGAGLVERTNGLLKEQLKCLGGGTFTGWVDHLTEAVRILNNRIIGQSSTPILRMKQEQIRTTKVANPGISVLQGTAFTATTQGGRYAVQSTTDITMASQETRWFRTDVTLYPATGSCLRLLCLTPGLLARGLVLLNPTQESGKRPLIFGIKKTSSRAVILPAAPWVLVYHVLNAPPTTESTRWFAGTRVWYRPPLGQPVAAEVIAADDSRAVTIVVQGESAWRRVPAQHLTRRE